MTTHPLPETGLFSERSTEAPFISFPERIRKAAADHPDMEVLRVGERVHTWRTFMPRINRVSNLLQSRGIGRGDKVAVLATSSLEYIEVFLGTVQAGACLVPLSGMASSSQLQGMIEDSGAAMVFASASTRGLIDPFRGQVKGLPDDGYVAFDFTADGWAAYEQVLAAQSDQEVIIPIQPEDAFNLIYSSGTTGVPKGIEQSHHMRNQHVARFEKLGFEVGAVTLSSTALYSNTTLVAMLPTLALGGQVVLMPKFNVDEYLKLAEKHKVTHTMLVPVQYQRILASPDFDSYDLSHFRMKMSTSAQLRADVKADALKRWPGKLIEIYGLTEGGIGTVLVATDFPDKLASVGKPGEGVDLRIINEAGEELPQGEIGEVVGRSDAMMTGYHNKPEQTSDMLWTSPEGKIFFRSGDMGRLDEDNFLYLLDRKKDMILSGGFNIYAADIEAELFPHPAVADAAVIAIPSEEWGETPLALVVKKAGDQTTEAELMAWVNERLGKTQRVSGVKFRDDLPRNTIGKVMKRELREEYSGK
ncbi:class I adenylate-forming enzyme family protein [Sneathiella chinensis]|uniref:4-coumarate--CoA ligase n=1 Tax=Sneathiella chinensis TaxID=349750 RepID=A0ABQ5U431_9PROT|nr:class I adenylate-forming enzyme family protein [Sneathiella chinensis]GLQ06493.1 4-coumarate--CoA ligase [Sneathiella chinensis]